MAQKIGTPVSSYGLVASYDMGNTKCFGGGPTTNLLNSTVNSYPQVGNSWGTYNTNQHNGGNFFSIGSVSAINNNVVTMSAAHPLRTYDVVTPQTTGGGVTAGTNYFVKRWTTTTFSLYGYDNNQNGTNGWKTRAAINNDTRVTINSSSFPTMWYGPAHLPNSGLVKTIVPGAFNGHECVRFNFDRSDGIVDAMAYGGGTPTLTSGSAYTYSFWYRAANQAAIGKTINWTNHYYASAYGVDLGTTNPMTKDWQRHVAAGVVAPSTSTLALYWWPGATNSCSIDVSEIQIETGSVVTPFTPTSRGATVASGGGLYDLSGKGNHGTLVNGPVYGGDFGGSLILNGTTQYATISPQANTIRVYDCTITFAVRLPLYSGGQRCILSYRGGSGGALYIGKSGGGIYCYYDQLNSPGYTVGSINNGSPVVVSVVMNSTLNTLSTYINGALAGSTARTGWVSAYNTLVNLGYDAGGTNEYMTGSFYYYAHHNRILSPDEIATSYTLLKSRLKI